MRSMDAMRYIGFRTPSGRLVACVDDVVHALSKLDGFTLSVTFVCQPNCAVLVEPDTVVYERSEIDVNCMSCLVARPGL